MNVPDQIGRFKIIKELGRGSQGVVYLAADEHLERKVAIKTLHLHLSENGDRKKRLLQEAKTVGRLQHPNIIPVYDAGEYNKTPYLVFEFVEGIPLKEYIQKKGTIVVHEAISMLIKLLDGIDYAHKQGIIHRDLSPNNVMIGKNQVPRIMDFGISIMTGIQRTQDSDASGTPCYMSPEHFSNAKVGPQSDIFSLALVFYEMLIGRPAIQAENHFAVMYKIANDPIDPPSTKSNTVDKELDRIVLKALEKNLKSRYANALVMKQDFEEYLSLKNKDDEIEEEKQKTHSTLEFLLRKMKHKSDFPSFSKHVTEINKKASVSMANYSSAAELANSILKDYSLTNKLLKLVNSAFYGQFSGKITTVSRAVIILGFEQVRMAASSLMLFEHLSNKSQSQELQDAAVSSFMSGIISQDLAKKIGFQATEEAFICSMLHNLGRTLVMYYFPEEHKQIMNFMEQKGVDEKKAAFNILGISYENLGIGVAGKWAFPAKIIESMNELPKGKIGKPNSEEDTLRSLSGFSNELCAIAGAEGQSGEKDFKDLSKRFEDCFPVRKKMLSKLLDSAQEKVEEYSETLNINMKKSRFMKQVSSVKEAREEENKKAEVEARKPKPVTETDLNKSGSFKPEQTQTIEIKDVFAEIDDGRDTQTILINGIQEITNAILEESQLADVLNMILETIYRGFVFDHVIFCIRDNAKLQMKAVYGFGEDVDKILNKFVFKIQRVPDIFNLALIQGKDLEIANSLDLKIKKGIPEWYQTLISAPAFVLFPVMVNQKAVGLIYADKNKKGPMLKGNHLNYMKTLCNQAVLAFKQSTSKR